MKRSLVLKLAAGVALASVFTGIYVQRGETNRLAEEKQVLLEQQQELVRLNQEHAELPRLRAAMTNLVALRAEAEKIDQLRAEYWRQRPLLKDRDQLIAENQRLKAMPAPPPGPVSRLAQMPGYVPATQFTESGFATPQAALLTFFAAAQRGDLNRCLNCLTPANADRLQSTFSQLPEQTRANAGDEIMGPFRIKGFRIIGKEAPSDDKIILKLQLLPRPKRFR